MGCFSVSQDFKRRHRASLSPSASSSSLSVPASLVHNLHGSRYGEPPSPSPSPSLFPPPAYQPSLSCSQLDVGSHETLGPSTSFGSKPALRLCASTSFRRNHPAALTGSFSLRSSPQVGSFGRERCIVLLSDHLFPLPLPPMADDPNFTSLSSSPSLFSAPNSSSTATNPPTESAEDSSMESTSSSSSLPLSATTLATSSSCPLPLPPPPADSEALLREFSFDELAGACQAFIPQFCIRDGGAGPVFRAVVKDKDDRRREVAVTCLRHVQSQSYKRWRAEVSSLARLSHPHVCKVVGFCGEDLAWRAREFNKTCGFQWDRERLLVYEHTSNGCLENLLYGRLGKAPLDWITRLRIAVGAAKGLAFLHGRTPRQIMYKSFKALNVQVDKDFNAKLSDYGFTAYLKYHSLASSIKPSDLDDAYAAPEMRAGGELSASSNVWSFGIMLLELLTGRQNMDEMFPDEERNLHQWARPYLLDAKRLYLVMDPELKGRYSTQTAKVVSDLALLCLSEDPLARPSMRQVAVVLSSLMPSSGSQRSSMLPIINSNTAILNSFSDINAPSKLKSKSYNLASVLASPGRSFASEYYHRHHHHDHHPSRTRFRAFLSGEITKEASRSMAAVAAMEHRHQHHSLALRYGFASCEILQASAQRHHHSHMDSPISSSQDYLPPPLGRSLA